MKFNVQYLFNIENIHVYDKGLIKNSSCEMQNIIYIFQGFFKLTNKMK